jgi:DNA polymerase eta
VPSLVAVQQWQSLIAVNYAARAAGVSKSVWGGGHLRPGPEPRAHDHDGGVARFSTVENATVVCPTIRMVHVATYAEGDEEARYHETVDRQTHKVSLDPYRREVRPHPCPTAHPGWHASRWAVVVVVVVAERQDL